MKSYFTNFKILSLFLLFSPSFLLAGSFDFNGLRFESKNLKQNGSSFYGDSIAMGYSPSGDEDFKPLVMIAGNYRCFQLDTLDSSNSARLTGPYSIRILDSKYVIELNLTTQNRILPLDSLLGNGLTLNDSLKLSVVGAGFKPMRMKFNNPDTASTSKSLVELLGSIDFSEMENFKLPLSSSIVVKCTDGSFVLDTFSVSLNSNFKIKSSGMKDANLQITYTPANKCFSFFGTANFLFGTDTLGVTLGIGTDPGIKIVNGSVQFIGFTVNNSFSINKLSMKGQNLSILYDFDSLNYKIFGRPVTAFVGPDTLSLTFKTQDDPGIVIRNGQLVKLSAGFSSKMKFGGLAFSVDSLNFEWLRDSSEYVVYGGPAGFSLPSGENFNVSFGTSPSNAGLKIKSGKLKQLIVGLTSQINIGGAKIETKNLTFEYYPDSSKYVLYGGPSGFTLASGENFYVTFGKDPQNAGLIIKSGKLKQMIIGISSDFNIGGVKIESNNLTFEYHPDSSKYVLYGGPTGFVLANKDSFNVSFGTGPQNPGLIVEKGKLTSMIVEVSSSFTIGGTKIEANKLTFEYIPVQKKYALYGGPTGFTLASKDSFSVSFGSAAKPGLLVESGSLKQMILTVAGNFIIGAANCSAKALTMEYYSDSSKYVMYGGPADIKPSSDLDFSISFSDSARPGLIISHGKLKQMLCTINTDFKIGGASFDVKNLHLEYIHDSSSFVIYGGPSTFKIDSEVISVSLGNSITNAGLRIVKNKLKDFYITVDGDLTFAELTFKPKGLSFQYKADSNSYAMWGGVSFNLNNQTLDLQFGKDSSYPGLLIKKGKLEQIVFGITSDFDIGGLKVTSKNAGFAWLSKDATKQTKYGKPKNPYNKSVFALFGGVGIKTFFSAGVDVGTMDDPGIYIIKDGSRHRVDIDSIYGQIADVDLGTFNIKKAGLGYSKKYINVTGDFVIADKFEIGSKFAFLKEKDVASSDSSFILKQIDFTLTPGARAIPIGSTDVFLTKLTGSITNIDMLRTNPKNLTFTTDVDLCFGEHFYSESDQKAFDPVHISGNATITSNSITINSAEAIILAFSRNSDFGKNKWDAALAKTSGSALIDWTHNNYYIKGKLSFPDDPGVTINTDLSLRGHNIGYLGDVNLKVPDYIPIIGGMKLGSADGAMLMRMDDPGSNFVASWLTIKIGIKHIYTKKIEYGIKLEFPIDLKNPSFHEKYKFKLIGSSQVKDIKKLFNTSAVKQKSSANIASESMKNVVHSFNIDDSQNAYYCLGKVNFKTPVDLDKIKIIVKGPGGDINPTKLLPDSSGTGYMAIPDGTEMKMTDSCLRFIFSNSLDFNADSNWYSKSNDNPVPPALLQGLYEILTYYPSSVHTEVDFEAAIKPADPLIKLQSTKLSDSTVRIDATLWNGITDSDSTELTLYTNDTTNYEGHVVSRFMVDNKAMQNSIYKHTFTARIEQFAPGKSHYFYASLHDTSTGLIFSEFSAPIEAKPDIYGFVKDSATGRPIGNIVLYLDENSNGISDRNEVSAITDSTTGAFYFTYPRGSSGFNYGSKAIRIYVGKNIENYQLTTTSNSPNQNPAFFDFKGKPVEINFTIKEQK